METRIPLSLRSAAPRLPHDRLLPAEEVARLADIHLDLVLWLVDFGLIDPVETMPEPCFEVSAVLRIRRIVRIHRDLGVNWNGLGLVMDLLARIEELEREVARLKAKHEDR